jgi:hypothetical protein
MQDDDPASRRLGVLAFRPLARRTSVDESRRSPEARESANALDPPSTH